MNIYVSSRTKLPKTESLLHKREEDYVIISMRGADERLPFIVLKCLRPRRKAALFMKFDDVNKDHDGWKTITDEQSAAISEFILRHKDLSFVCQCDAGISRSSAVAAAISNFFTGDDGEFVKGSRYYPNEIVYSKVLDHLNK